MPELLALKFFWTLLMAVFLYCLTVIGIVARLHDLVLALEQWK